MRKKELKLIVTFHTNADAMAMEKICKERNIPGRLIPVPRFLSSGCGISWCADPSQKEAIISIMMMSGIDQEDIHECLI